MATLLLGGPNAIAANSGCPTAAEVSTALGFTAEDESGIGTCNYKFKFGSLKINFTEAADMSAAFAAKRAEGLIRSAPVVKTKVGKYQAFTNAGQGQARLTYDQKQVTVLVIHFEVSPRSADLLNSLAGELAKFSFPKRMTECSKVTAMIQTAIADAKFSGLNGSFCKYTLTDSSYLLFGTLPDNSYAEVLAMNQGLRTGVRDFSFNGKAGFAYSDVGWIAVVNLGNRIATVDFFGTSGIEGAITVARLLN